MPEGDPADAAEPLEQLQRHREELLARPLFNGLSSQNNSVLRKALVEKERAPAPPPARAPARAPVAAPASVPFVCCGTLTAPRQRCSPWSCATGGQYDDDEEYQMPLDVPDVPSAEDVEAALTTLERAARAKQANGALAATTAAAAPPAVTPPPARSAGAGGPGHAASPRDSLRGPAAALAARVGPPARTRSRRESGRTSADAEDGRASGAAASAAAASAAAEGARELSPADIHRQLDRLETSLGQMDDAGEEMPVEERIRTLRSMTSAAEQLRDARQRSLPPGSASSSPERAAGSDAQLEAARERELEAARAARASADAHMREAELALSLLNRCTYRF